jgi:hypothetical protein
MFVVVDIMHHHLHNVRHVILPVPLVTVLHKTNVPHVIIELFTQLILELVLLFHVQITTTSIHHLNANPVYLVVKIVMVFNAHLALFLYHYFLKMKKEFVLPVLLDIIFFLIIVTCVINNVQLVMAVQSIHVHPVILPFIITHNHCKLVQLLVDKDIIYLKIVLVQPVILRVTLVLLV